MSFTKTKIASGQSLSGVVDLRGKAFRGVMYPSAWTAADLSIQISPDGTTFGEAFTDPGTGTGTAMALDAAASQVSYLTSPAAIADCFIKLRSGPSGVPVNQGADRDIFVLTSSM